MKKEQQPVTYLPPTKELRAWARHPAKSSGTVPVHPETLLALADEIDWLRSQLPPEDR